MIEPVISDEGRSAALCSELEWDEQPDKTRQVETIADKANERMRTRMQDKSPKAGATTRATDHWF